MYLGDVKGKSTEIKPYGSSMYLRDRQKKDREYLLSKNGQATLAEAIYQGIMESL